MVKTMPGRRPGSIEHSQITGAMRADVIGFLLRFSLRTSPFPTSVNVLGNDDSIGRIHVGP